MSNIRGVNTKPEIVVRKFLHQNGIRFRLHDKTLPGKPDIKIPRYNSIIFVNGCFWHGHTHCRQYVMPKTNKTFWYQKIEANIKRDSRKIRKLRRQGWHVYLVWECQLSKSKIDKTLSMLLKRVLKNEVYSK